MGSLSTRGVAGAATRLGSPRARARLLGHLWLSGLLVAVGGVPVRAQAPGEFDALFARARDALQKSDLSLARSLCRQAFERSGDPPGGGPNSSHAMELCGDVAMKQRRFRGAHRAFKRAAASSVSDRASRRRLLRKRRRAAREARLALEVERVHEIVRHDAAVDALMHQTSISARRRDEIRSAIDAAIQIYREDGDLSSERLATAVRALAFARAGLHEDAFADASTLAWAPENSKIVRSCALEATWISGAALERFDAAARAAVELNALRHEGLPEAKRRYARIRGLDAVCARYEETRAPGSCARLERDVTGAYTFTDFSIPRPKRELSDGDVERVHTQFLPAIEDCVREAARRSPDTYVGSELRIGWAIQPRGRATDVEIAPRRYKDDLEGCVTERVGWLRYPRFFSGERKTVTVPYRLGE